MTAEEITRGERAMIAAWLRDPATVMALCEEYVVRRKDGQPTAGTQHNRGVAFMYLMDAADAIERGDHLAVRAHLQKQEASCLQQGR